jgi:hypothetical protein
VTILGKRSQCLKHGEYSRPNAQERCHDVLRQMTQIGGVRLRSVMSTDRRMQPIFGGGITGGIGESERSY